MALQRKFNGKYYRHRGCFGTKGEAKRLAEKYRNLGNLVRITPYYKNHSRIGYDVWTRDKK